MSKSFEEALGIPKSATFEEKYQIIINALGYEEVKKCIPFSIESIMSALETDENLNNLPLKVWDTASGFIQEGSHCHHIGSPLNSLFQKIGVTYYSNAEGVCILKECARMWAQEEMEKQFETEDDLSR